MDSPLSTMKSRSSRIRNEKLGSEGGSFLRDWLWLTGLMHWSVRGSCFASCSNRRVPYRSLQNPTEAEGLCGLVRRVPVRTVLYCTVHNWMRTRKTKNLVVPPRNKNQQQQHNNDPPSSNRTITSWQTQHFSLCLSLFAALSLFALSLSLS
jgi:hypothetical protein